MDLEQINNTYGKIIWSVAGRYHMGIWEQTDVYNEILLQVFTAMREKQIPSDGSDESLMLIKGFVICKSIDIIRKEYKRTGKSTVRHNRSNIEEFNENDVESRISEYEYELEKRLIWEVLETYLPIKSAVFIYELTFPSPETVAIAMGEQESSKKDTRLRMNINELRILPRHVAESLGPEFKLSKPTMSRIKKQARAVAREVMGLQAELKGSYVTKGT